MPPLEEADDLIGLLDDIETASKVPAKRRGTSIKPTIEKAIATLYERGASPDELGRIVDLLTLRNHLDQASLSALVRNLYPVGKVNDDALLRVVGALGHGHLKPSLVLQGLLLRWLVMVYHLLENASTLSRTYGVLFNLLDTAAIRPQLCHLLALITRRKHVRPFRIQAILTLARKTGSDPALIGLLRVFKNYYPEIIVGDATKGRAAIFKHPDLQWRERLEEIRHQHAQLQDDTGRNGFAVNHALARQMRGTRTFNVPAVYTQHAQENSITLEEVDNPEFFANNFDKIELPTQLVAILADPLLQKLLLLRPDAEAFSRIRNWLRSCLSDVKSGDAEPSMLVDMLELIHEYAMSIKTLPPLLVSFFDTFLANWDGKERREQVLETLAFVPYAEFETLYKQLFLPLEQSLLDNTPESQLALLRFYTLLLKRWTVLIRAETRSETLPQGSIYDLVSHVGYLCLTLSQTSPSVGAHLAILDFYQDCATLFSHPEVLPQVEISIPPPILVYLIHFSNSILVLSRLCDILATYKRTWEVVLTPPTASSLTKREREQINGFNGFLMDLCNCIWRGRAFAASGVNAQGCRIPRSLEPILQDYVRVVDSDLNLVSLFGLSYSPVFCLQAITYFREKEDEEDEEDGLRIRHAGPVSQSSLAQLSNRGGLHMTYQVYRTGVLHHLERIGLKGVPELMYSTLKGVNRAQ
ncbi:hypothetical protein OQA88_6892 [Cercophora sp. LCS_1]